MKTSILITIIGLFLFGSVHSQIQEFPSELKIRSQEEPCKVGYPWGYTKFYPIGWSDDGLKFAYFSKVETDGRGIDGVFQIFDLSANKIVFACGGEGSPENEYFENPENLFEQLKDTIGDVLLSYGIESSSEINYQQGSVIHHDNNIYFLHAEISIEDELYYTMANYARIVVIKEGVGSKNIFEYKKEENNDELFWGSNIEPLGMLIAPNSNKAIILSDHFSRGFEGGQDSDVMLVAFDLKEEFTW